MPTAPRAHVTVVGRVVGPSGEPLPGTYLYFRPGEPSLHFDDADYTATDSSGAYSVQLLSGTYRVEIEPPMGFLWHEERVTVSEERNRADFAFLGFKVTGTVMDPTGNPLESGYVDVEANLPGIGYGTSLVTRGAYSLLLPAGRYRFVARPADSWLGFAPLWRESVPVASDTTIILQLDGILVSGKVSSPDGLPMANVSVEAEGPGLFVSARYRTSVDGSYRLYVPAGSYRFLFRPPYPFYIIPRIIGPITITGPASVDCDLSGTEWSGIVRRSDSDEAVPGILVGVHMLADPDERGAGIRTGSEGEFRFIVEKHRQYDLTAYDPRTYEEVAKVEGLTARADTTFEILIPQERAKGL